MVSLDRTKRTELPEHDSRELWTRVSGLRSRDRTTRTRQPGRDSQDRKAVTGELGQESQKDRQDNTARLNYQTAWTGEPGQNREDKSGHESNARTTASGKPWKRLLGQYS